MTRIVIMGGGPAGYEAALVAAQHGAEVTVVERDGIGGACVLVRLRPVQDVHRLGRRPRRAPPTPTSSASQVDRQASPVDLPAVNDRVKGLALAQSADVRAASSARACGSSTGTARFSDEPPGLAAHGVDAATTDGETEELAADVVLIATGATPRVLPDARARRRADPQLAPALRPRGAARAPDRGRVRRHRRRVRARPTSRWACEVTLISSRDRVLPGEDADAAAVLEDVFAARGIEHVDRRGPSR